jgi:spore coat polysaccharide biosynthesis predicted glycosyltransferase SpsG
MIIRNTHLSRQFFSDYKKLCENKELLKKWPNPDPHPEYTHSCPEQHIMNCLAYSYVIKGKLPAYSQLLLGPRYALLREEFVTLREHVKIRTGDVKKILVFFGGVDANIILSRKRETK